MKEKRAPQPSKPARTILTVPHQVKIAENKAMILKYRGLLDRTGVDARDRHSVAPAGLQLCVA